MKLSPQCCQLLKHFVQVGSISKTRFLDRRDFCRRRHQFLMADHLTHAACNWFGAEPITVPARAEATQVSPPIPARLASMVANWEGRTHQVER